MSFQKLGLSDELLKAIDKQGYTTPSSIQAKVIPKVLQRKDILASSQTGTGKTAGFTLPILEILSKQHTPKKRPIRALVLTPTRELAAQVYENVRSYSEFIDFRSTVIFGGVKQHSQVRNLRNGVDLLVATPGRLLDLVQQGLLSLSQVEILILDEADRMLDMGFLRDIRKIINELPKNRQNLLFSATFSKEIKKLSSEFLNDPVLVEATPENSTAEKVIQKAYRLDKVRKKDLLIKMISDGDWLQALVFTRTKHGANKLCKQLIGADISAAAIHGNKTQNARTKALTEFKTGQIRVLVATDIAARGLDIPLLPHVVNFELPNVPEDYVHRIGRTGRAGASGIAMSLVSSDELVYLKDIEKLLGQKIPMEIVEGFEPVANPADEVAPKKQQFSRRNNSSRNNSSSRNNNSSRSKSNSKNSSFKNRISRG